MINAQFLADYMHREVPLSVAMGLAVDRLEPEAIRLSAPLEPNLNDKMTAFGGSQAAIMALTGWGLVFTNLQRLKINADVVIHRCELVYHAPVSGRIHSGCDRPEKSDWEGFLNTLERRGRARITVRPWIEGATGAAATMEGKFAAVMMGNEK